MNNEFEAVMNRILWATNLKNASALAGKLDLTPQALSNYKRRGIMPFGVIFQIAKKYGISMDWLLGREVNVFVVSDPEEEGARGFMPNVTVDEEETRI